MGTILDSPIHMERCGGPRVWKHMGNMNFRSLLVSLTVGFALLAPALAPTPAYAQSKKTKAQQHRQKQKNDWRNLGYLGGAVGLYGLLKHDNALAALGLGGGAYSAYRYEQDRKSQSKADRQRAALFNRRSFNYQGHHYVRASGVKKGKKFYYFKKTR